MIKHKMQPPSLHSSFFSSLKQVEKRLKLENAAQSLSTPSQPPPPQATEANFALPESLSTPIYLQTGSEPINNSNSITVHDSESSEPPLAFLSSSLHSSPTHQSPLQETTQHDPKPITQAKSNDLDDIQHLMLLLGLSEGNKDIAFGGDADADGNEWVGCERGFYEKIVGVKGPKCREEVERLDGWIKYFLGDGKKREPLRLAFLLVGKAAFELERGGGGGFGGLEFPSTIEEFLKLDPPGE